ncbi:MAG: exodeoxyribonuclease VII large subunit [Clostridia bacterium]|nr:exodeoxyribonuclease VII large subunit [Clostridia bacterium]
MAGFVMEVSDLNEYVRRTLASDPMLRDVRLRGEISNFKRHTSGHWYFTLKDAHCRITCVMFRQNAMRMSIRPTDGMQVIVTGSVSLYAEGGTYQLYCEAMRPDGLGTLYQQFEALKARLQAEGLFDAARKRPLPLRPRKIAVVTARTGAVLQDIRRVSAARDPGVPLVLLPVKVQGAGAAEEIAAAVRRAGLLPDVDAVIVGRGGGSMEDLWAFNEEIVARAIADCCVPVISAVGHETDFTIADFVADVRASTPSNAAEIAVPDRAELLEAIRLLRRQLDQQAAGRIQHERMRLVTRQRRLQAQHPQKRLSDLQTRLTLQRMQLHVSATMRLTEERLRLTQQVSRLERAADMRIRTDKERLARIRTRLEAVSPTRVLARGYALVTAGDRVITSAAAAGNEDAMRLVFRDGSVQVHRTKEE